MGKNTHVKLIAANSQLFVGTAALWDQISVVSIPRERISKSPSHPEVHQTTQTHRVAV